MGRVEHLGAMPFPGSSDFLGEGCVSDLGVEGPGRSRVLGTAPWHGQPLPTPWPSLLQGWL